jgi:hypothetical protein
VLALALGPANGTPLRRISVSARMEHGILAPNVDSPAVTSGARTEFEGLGNMMVRGPGQNFSIRGR